MTWTVHLVGTMDGRVGAQIPAAEDGGAWTDTINGPGSISVKVPTPWLLAQPRWSWSPWSGSLLACYDGEPIALGPIVEEPAGDRDFVTLTAGGLWSLLERRVVTADDITDGPALARSTFSLREGSLGVIARRLVEAAQKRPRGWFPISYGSPVEAGANRVRNYEGFNLGNNGVGKRLSELTEVINGPDIGFRPRWTERNAAVEWVMYHGTEGMPQIAQQDHFVIDLTAPRSRAVLAQVSAQGEHWGRAYASGAGEGAGTLIRVETGPNEDRMPLLETVASDTQVESLDLLTERARGKLGLQRTVQVKATIDTDDTLPMHRFWAGDEMTVDFPEGWAQLPAGAHRMRVLSRSGDFSTGRVSVEFQPESLGVGTGLPGQGGSVTFDGSDAYKPGARISDWTERFEEVP